MDYLSQGSPRTHLIASFYSYLQYHPAYYLNFLSCTWDVSALLLAFTQESRNLSRAI